MRRAAFAAVAALVVLPSVSTAQEDCRGCTSTLSLTSYQWRCLESRLPRLARDGSPRVVVDLTPEACRRRGMMVVVPKADPCLSLEPGAYCLSPTHVRCLRDKARQIERAEHIEIDLAALCDADTRGTPQ